MRLPRPVRRLLDELTARDPEYDARRRAARAGLMIPVAAALGIAFGTDQTTMYAIFGAIALLIVVDFPGTRPGRAVSYLTLGGIGAGLIALGTAVAPHPWLAVATMFALGVAVTFSGVLSASAAAAQRAILMTFVLPVCTPVGPVPDRLQGWAIALAVSLPAALFVFPPRHHDKLRRHCSRVCTALADRLEGRADAREVNAAMNALFAHYVNGEFRPVGLTAGSRALVRVVDDLGWLTDRITDDTAAALGAVTGPAVRVLRESALLLADPRNRRHAPDRTGLVTAITELRDISAGSYRESIRDILTEPDDRAAVAVGRRLLDRRTFGAQVGATGRLINRAAAADSRPVLNQVLGRGMPTARASDWVLSEIEAVAHMPSGYLSGRSVVVRNSLRTGLGLALAVATTQLFPVQHGFWVVLASISVLRSTALTTGTTVLRAVLGTCGGFAVGAVLIELLGVNPVVMWLMLPVVAFLAAFVPKLWSFAAGQAAFTMLVLIVFNLIHPSGWQVGLLRIEDILVGGTVGAVVSTLLWPRGTGNAVQRAIRAASDVGFAYLRAAVGRITGRTDPAAVAALGVQALAAASTLDDGLRQYLSESGGPADIRTPIIQETNRVTALRAAADLIADIPRPPAPEAYPGTRAVLDDFATAVCDRAGDPVAFTAHFVTALRAESAEVGQPITDALPLVSVAANLGELAVLYPEPYPER